VALEIGTTKVIAMVAEMLEDRTIMVSGVEQVSSVGVRKGEIVDLANVSVYVKRVLESVERTSNVSVAEVYLCTSAGHIQGKVNRGTIPIGGDGEVADDDMDEVAEVARSLALPEERQVIHTIHGHYEIDGQSNIISPEGMLGNSLSLDMLVLHGVRSLITNVSRGVTSLNYDVADIAFGGLCSALAVLTAEQKKNGVLVIDLGGGTTDFMAYVDGVASCGGAIGVGGDHVTNDIQQAFAITTQQAERLKKDHGCALVGTGEEPVWVSLPSDVGYNQNTVNVRNLHTVIHVRMKETLEMVKKQLDNVNALPLLRSGVVLTGGGAHMKGIVELAEQIFGCSCSIGQPRGMSGIIKAVSGPEHAACCGLLRYGFKVQSSEQDDRGGLIIGRLKSLLGM
jgi:cell division protein FtsA